MNGCRLGFLVEMKMDALKLLLDNHAWVHSRAVNPDGMRHIEDELCEGLAQEQLRPCSSCPSWFKVFNLLPATSNL
jgi:hypothetical protein